MHPISVEMLSGLYSYAEVSVGVMMAAACLGSAIGWGLICAKTLEGIARQPELRASLMVNMFIFAGLMESFPFIVLAFAMWFLFANPFVGAFQTAAAALQ